MKPLMIEVSFDDGEQVVPSGIPGWVASLLHEFGFQSAEATFRRCVDPEFPSFLFTYPLRSNARLFTCLSGLLPIR